MQDDDFSQPAKILVFQARKHKRKQNAAINGWEKCPYIELGEPGKASLVGCNFARERTQAFDCPMSAFALAACKAVVNKNWLPNFFKAADKKVVDDTVAKISGKIWRQSFQSTLKDQMPQ